MSDRTDQMAIGGMTLLGVAALTRHSGGTGNGGGGGGTPPPATLNQQVRDGSGTVMATASRVLFGANAQRVFLTIVNDGDDTVYVVFGDTATAHTGIRLNANGGSLALDAQSMYYGTVSCISHSADNMVVAQEVFNNYV